MELDLDALCKKHNVRARGIVHVGAHLGQEYQAYRKLFPDQKITWIEADPAIYEQLADAMKNEANVSCLNEVVSDVRETVTFNRANNQQSSSFLDLGTHSVAHPDVWFVDSFEAETVTLDHLARGSHFNHANFLVMDIQGAEGKAISGSSQFLKQIDYVYSEVNRDELYVGCTTLTAFDKLLERAGFIRVETSLREYEGWGDAFYVRRTLPVLLRTRLEGLWRWVTPQR